MWLRLAHFLCVVCVCARQKAHQLGHQLERTDETGQRHARGDGKLCAARSLSLCRAAAELFAGCLTDGKGSHALLHVLDCESFAFSPIQRQYELAATVEVAI